MRRMDGNSKQNLGWIAMILVLITTAAKGQVSTTPAQNPGPERRIVISVADRKLAIFEGSRLLKVYNIAVGKPSTPSPRGVFKIKNRVQKPSYYKGAGVIPDGPQNPVGTRWVGLSDKGYGIHGTNAPQSIGKAASHGCIRMRNQEIEELFEMVRVGDTVDIRGERDEETAQIFGTATPVVMAQAGTEVAVQHGGQ